jgi:hypothetical protein
MIMPNIVFLFPSFQPNALFCDLLEKFERVRQTPDTTTLTNAINLGKGAALKHGMNHIVPLPRPKAMTQSSSWLTWGYRR